MIQLDIWGNENEVEEGSIENPVPRSIKGKFREEHGYIEGKQCKDCEYFAEYEHNNKKYFKCIKMGVSMSEATDIRKKDKACRLFKENGYEN